MRLIMVMVAMVCVFGAQCQAQAGGDYADPNGAFAIAAPLGWKTVRTPLGAMGFSTAFAAGEGELVAKVEIVSLTLGPQPVKLEDMAKVMFQVVLASIQQQGQVLSQQTSAAKLGGMDAVRYLTYQRTRNGPIERGYMLAALGKRFALVASVSAQKSDDANFATAEKALTTLAIESRTATGGAPAVVGGKSLLDAGTMAFAAQQFQGNLQRSANSVLVAGDPPLTHGSVAAFVTLLSMAFDIHLTETEFALTQQRFIEYYKKNDAQGRRIIALGGQDMLSRLMQGSKEQQIKDKAEIKAVMADRFANGAKLGIEWAVAMNDAIQRRSQMVATTTAQQPQAPQGAQIKKTFSQADLEAALEMFYFMWVASGRDASAVTPQAVAQVRAALVQNFNQFSPDFQYLLCNAEAAYAAMRGAYQNADANGRRALAGQYAKALDELGLTAPRKAAASAWDDCKGMSESSIRAQTMMNYAYSAATSKSFSGRSVSY